MQSIVANGMIYKELDGDGDFMSDECQNILREADVVISNPPFSLFRKYVANLVEHDKDFLIIGSLNAITYKEVFPLIKENEMWLGVKSLGVDTYFDIPKTYADELVAYKKEGSAYKIINGKIMGRVQICWFTNIEHGRRHEPLALDTMANNLRFNNSIKSNANSYQKYDNYDAIEIPRVEGIPCDYEGVMGVPISFLDKYCPEQFEIIKFRKGDDDKDLSVNGKCPYFRILIKHKNPTENSKPQ